MFPDAAETVRTLLAAPDRKRADELAPLRYSRGHFFGAAAQAMRHLPVDQARRRAAVRHGGKYRRVDLDPEVPAIRPPVENLPAIDRALTRLEKTDPRSAWVVMLRAQPDDGEPGDGGNGAAHG